MTLPHILLVDDSDAILAYEKATLSAHYTISTATTGVEALEKIPLVRPELVLLDLSMPQMDGEEVLKRCKADPKLEHIPFIVISAEHERAEACKALGAAAILPKPIRADALTGLVARVLEEARQQEHEQGMAALLMDVGGTRLGIPLHVVHSVVLQPECRPLPLGPFYMAEMFDFEGEPVCVLDMPLRLGLEHTETLAERKMILLKIDGRMIALNVDDVQDPEEFPTSRVIPPERFGAATHKPLRDALLALVNTDEGPVPVVDPQVFLSGRALRDLHRSLEHVPSGDATGDDAS
jgi:CheY-like chemotaxis protein